MECSGGDGCNAQYLVVPVTPQLRVRHDYEYRWFNVELDRSGFLNDLSSALHRDIAMYVHAQRHGDECASVRWDNVFHEAMAIACTSLSRDVWR